MEFLLGSEVPTSSVGIEPWSFLDSEIRCFLAGSRALKQKTVSTIDILLISIFQL